MAEQARPPINWVDAARQHRLVLQQFTCATPNPRMPGERRLSHPRQYELVAQSLIRTLKPPVHGGVVQLGMVHDSVASVAHFTYLTEPSQLSPVVFINVIGLSVDHRGGDGTVADRTLTQVLKRAGLDLSQQNHSDAVAVGNIHHRNLKSQAFVERGGFEPLGPRTGDYQQWALAFNW